MWQRPISSLHRTDTSVNSTAHEPDHLVLSISAETPSGGQGGTMKFCKVLSEFIDDDPARSELFIRYKKLKKILKKLTQVRSWLRPIPPPLRYGVHPPHLLVPPESKISRAG